MGEVLSEFPSQGMSLRSAGSGDVSCSEQFRFLCGENEVRWRIFFFAKRGEKSVPLSRGCTAESHGGGSGVDFIRTFLRVVDE